MGGGCEEQSVLLIHTHQVLKALSRQFVIQLCRQHTGHLLLIPHVASLQFGAHLQHEMPVTNIEFGSNAGQITSFDRPLPLTLTGGSGLSLSGTKTTPQQQLLRMMCILISVSHNCQVFNIFLYFCLKRSGLKSLRMF